MRMHADKFVLINLEGLDSFVFDLFPQEVERNDRANWPSQDVTVGMKPIFYANREPGRISVPEVYLDGSRTNTPINEEIDALTALKDEIALLGRPPALLVQYGSRQHRCVMEEVTVTEEFFSADGEPLRARVRLQLLELQLPGEAVNSNVKPVPDKGTVVGG